MKPEGQEQTSSDPILEAAASAIDRVFPEHAAGMIVKAVIITEAITDDGERALGWVNSREISEWDAEGMVRYYLRNGLAEQTAREVIDRQEEE